ncbi:hypothetical protein GCM10009606_25250 [Nocardioides aquiterrae]|uniref:Uncharacterized protein n=1 Tax=Nocardioides aquiterrae TaxID=203799 RepID=A0ABP4EXZ7_9ACTN
MITSSVAIRLANAPYAWGPSRRAATIVNPYVATFMTAIATAMAPPPLSSWVTRRVGVTGGKRMRDSRA